MTDHDAASEQIAETEPGVESLDRQLNPHLGHMDPDQQSDDNRGSDQDGQAAEETGDSPAPDEEKVDKQPDDHGLQSKVAELAFENRQLKRQLEQRQTAEPEAPEQREPLKTLKDFGYDEQAFNEYLIDEGSRRAEARMERRQAETTQVTEAERLRDEFASREDAFEAENPGFKERLHKEDLKITPEMASFIMDPTSEVGLHVGDYLARNSVEAAKIAALNETGQVREMVKLEERIGKEVKKAKAAKSKTSQAPEPPVNPVDGSDPGISLDPANPKDAEAMTDEEWQAARNRQLEKRRKSR
jgi:hypothetical protein